MPVLRALEALSGIMQLRTGASRDPALIARIDQEARAIIAESPDFAHGHALLGFLAYELGDQVTAVRSLRRAHQLDPADGDIRFFHGVALSAAGHVDPRAGLEWIALDPLAPLANTLVAANTWSTGHFAEGLPAIEEAVRLAPAGPAFHWGLGNHYALLGRFDDARRQADWLTEHAAQLPYTAQLQGLVAAGLGRREEALAWLATLDQSTLDGHHTAHLAESDAMAGAHDTAVALLDRSVTMGLYPVDYIARVSPFFHAIRGREDVGRVVERARGRAAEFARAVG